MAKSILICDDAAFMRMMIKDILTKNGYTVAGEAVIIREIHLLHCWKYWIMSRTAISGTTMWSFR